MHVLPALSNPTIVTSNVSSEVQQAPMINNCTSSLFSEEKIASNEDVISKHIVLIRHGQAWHNVDSDYWWVPDDGLTEYGEQQLLKMREILLKQYKKQFVS